MNIVLFTRDEINRPLPFSDERAHHIINILKFKPGDSFDAGVINTGTGKAFIEKIENSTVYYNFSFTDKIIKKNPVSLITAVTRPSEAKKILTNSATIGINSLYLAVFDKTEKSYMESSLWKDENYLEYFTRGAAQAFAPDIPDLKLFTSLDDCLEVLPSDNTVKAALDNYEADESLSRLEYYNVLHTYLAVGGERGWSGRERELLKNHGFKLYSIGSRVLKTETACIAGLSIILGKTGIF